MGKPSKGITGGLPNVLKPLGMRTAALFCTFPALTDEAWFDDLWPGDPERGKRIVNRRFTLAGCDISFPRRAGWHAKEATLPWLRELHGFQWMRDVAAYHDEKKSAKRLRHFIEDWLGAAEASHAVANEPAVTGERLTNWVIYAAHVLQGAAPSFRRQLLRSMQSQAWRLRRALARQPQNATLLPAIKGLLFASLALPGCGFMYRDARVHLDYYLAGLHDLSGKSRERNPMYLHETLRGVIDIQAALRVRGYRDEALDAVVGELAQLLRHVLQQDGGFSLFNGAIEGEPTDIAYTLAYESVAGIDAGDAEALLERSGYARLEANDSLFIFDAGVPDYTHPDAYYGTLGFEWSHGGRRCIVNCGTYIGNDPAWSRVVRTTAAHSTLCLDNRNSCQFTGEYLVNAPFSAQEAQPQVRRRFASRDGYFFLEGIYNGYAPYSGLLHTRQLLINEEGTRFSGTDYLNRIEGYGEFKSHEVQLRFHLHPSVQAKRLMNGMVVLQLPGKAGSWSFQASVGQATELEESIYLGIEGRPMMSRQIVVYAPFQPDVHMRETPWVVEWSFLLME